MAKHDHDHVHGEIDRHEIRETLPAVVQIIALQKKMFGNLSSAWTGSGTCLLYTSPSPRDGLLSRMPSSA